MNALVVSETLTPAIFSQEGGIDAMLAKLEADVRAVQTDISTPAGRKAIASLAHKVARSKTAFDDMGKDLVADLKKQTGAIDAERKKVRDRLDALKEEVRRPLDEYEAAEAKRIAIHENTIQAIIDLGLFSDEMPASAEVVDRLAALESLPDRDWQEFKQRAGAARSETFAKLQALKGAALAREAEAAELARLRAEETARLQRERDEQIAAEAAARATREAEDRAEVERQRAARETAEATRLAAERERQAESDRLAAIARAEKAERDAAEAFEKSVRDAAAAAAKAETDRLAAIEAERQRVADIEAAAAKEAERRAADHEHKKRFNSEALEALIGLGLSRPQAVDVLTAVYRGAVPHFSITY
jgi:colicin import membrane protein